MKVQTISNSTTFQSKLPPKQEKAVKAPKKEEWLWKIWAADYWDEFAHKCEKEGLGDEFLDCMQKINDNGDEGILVFDRYKSGFGADSYVIGLYDSVEDIEKDRKVGIHNITRTRNGSQYLGYGINANQPSFHTTGYQTDERIEFPKGLSYLEEMLTILKRIANPNSKEAKHIGINPTQKLAELMKNMRIK